MTDLDLASVMTTRARPAPLNGNTPWASAYAGELRRVAVEHAARAPRSVQQHLGPSELGHACDRQVVGKMAAVPATNHVTDPWASIVGTAIHAWLADAFTGDNVRSGVARWLAEQRVVPHPDHPGTADLYDAHEAAVVDHKCQSESMAGKVRQHGPPLHYQVQLKLYGLGYHALGLPVRRVVLASWPRTKSTLDPLYVWETDFSPDDPQLAWVFQATAARTQAAQLVSAGALDIMQVPAAPSDDDCYFCPLYRPAATDGGVGCPGTKGTT